VVAPWRSGPEHGWEGAVEDYEEEREPTRREGAGGGGGGGGGGVRVRPPAPRPARPPAVPSPEEKGAPTSAQRGYFANCLLLHFSREFCAK
jgi:hypothetical protein